ncbi:EthD domain protein [compost metagenome]
MKYISLIRRRADLDRAAFRDYYERTHAPLALQFFPPELYQRNHLDDAPDEHPFDCLSEFVYPDAFDPMQLLQTEAGPALARDESNFMDRDSVRTARALPVRSHLPGAAGPRRREMWLFPPGEGTDAALRRSLPEVFERLLPNLAAGQGACLEWLEPYHCEAFPYAALITLEGAFPGVLPRELDDLKVTRLRVSSCPSPR